MPRLKSRPSKRKPKPKLLTAFRCIEKDVVTSTGFGRTLDVGDDHIMLESPDAFPVGQSLALEFLLDNDQIAQARGHVTQITKGKGMFRARVEFDKLPAKTRRLLERQVAG